MAQLFEIPILLPELTQVLQEIVGN